MDRATLEQYLRTGDGFVQFLGLEVERFDPEHDELTIKLPYRSVFSRRAEIGGYHGGVVAALLDVAGTFTCGMHYGQLGPTINLRVDYLLTPDACDLYATGKIIRAGRTVAVVDVSATDADGVLYAVGRGTWSAAAARPVEPRE
jgi:uncharacterized protein (TIGR00369 family)